MNFKKPFLCIIFSCLLFGFSGCNYENCKELFAEVNKINADNNNSEDPEIRKLNTIGYCMEWDFTPAARKQIKDDGCVKEKKSYEITGKVLKARKTPFVGKLFKDKKIDDMGTTKQVFSIATDSNGEFSVLSKVSSGVEFELEAGQVFPFYPFLAVKNSKNPLVTKTMGYLIPKGFSADNNFKRCPK